MRAIVAEIRIDRGDTTPEEDIQAEDIRPPLRARMVLRENKTSSQLSEQKETEGNKKTNMVWSSGHLAANSLKTKLTIIRPKSNTSYGFFHPIFRNMAGK